MTERRSPSRRRVLAGLAAALGAVAGCTGRRAGGGNGGDGRDPNADASALGAAAGSTSPVRARRRPADDGAASTNGLSTQYESVTVDGVSVPLVPVEDAYEWYAGQRAQFVDVRPAAAHEEARVKGAVHAPATEGDEASFHAGLHRKALLVVYGACGHEEAAARAANLRRAGFPRSYALSEGFGAWYSRGFPMAGTSVGGDERVYVVRGRTDPRYAGETVWLVHRPTGQREAAIVDAQGRYRFEVHFQDVTDASVVVVQTPDYAVERSLGELESSIVGAA